MASFQKRLGQALVFVISTLIFWLVFPFVYILATPFYAYRLIVKHLARWIHPEWVGIMNLRDVFVSERMENKSGLSSVVTMVTILRGEPNVEFIRRSFNDKVLLQRGKSGDLPYTKFKYYSEYWLGFPFWKREEDFTLDNHIRVWEDAVNPEMTEEEFTERMGPLATKPFRPQMSPWEMLIVPGYTSNSIPPMDHHAFISNNNEEKKDGDRQIKRFAIIFRFHHTLCDGFSMAKLFVENFGGQPKENTPKAPRKPPSFLTLCRYAVETLVQVGYCHLKILVWDYDFNPWHVPPSKLTGEWHTVMTDPLPFDLARETSKKTGEATTTVLFGAIAGGLQRYWQSTGRSDKEIPREMRALFPLPVRGHPLDGLVNHWTFANIPLPMGTPDATRRLRKIGRNFESLKNSPIPGLVWLFSPLYMGVPKWLINLWGTNRMTTLTLSNFPGPRKPILFFDQWLIEDTMYWLPRLRGNASVYLAMLTYKGSIRITMTTDKAVFPHRPDAQKFIQCIQDELFSYESLKSQTSHTEIDMV